MSDNVDEDFVIKAADACATDEQWLALMNFGLQSLLERPAFLLELIVMRAEAKVVAASAGKAKSTKRASDYAREIISSLKLKFEQVKEMA